MSKGNGLQIILPKPKVVFKVLTNVDPTSGTTAHEAAINGPMDPIEVAAHQARYKLASICANCTRWFDGIDRGVKIKNGDPRCTAMQPCGGLAVRRGYPEYNGLLTDEYLQSHCVVCEAEAPKSVTTPDGKRRGYCLEHFDAAVKILGGV